MSNGSPVVIRAEVEKALAKSGVCKLKDFNIDDKSKTDTMVCGVNTIHNETTFHGGDSFETTTTALQSPVLRPLKYATVTTPPTLVWVSRQDGNNSSGHDILLALVSRLTKEAAG